GCTLGSIIVCCVFDEHFRFGSGAFYDRRCVTTTKLSPRTTIRLGHYRQGSKHDLGRERGNRPTLTDRRSRFVPSIARNENIGTSAEERIRLNHRPLSAMFEKSNGNNMDIRKIRIGGQRISLRYRNCWCRQQM
ncbi:hypothetical protein BIW11_09162, partial [Tropilaelaps mercedesae]